MNDDKILKDINYTEGVWATLNMIKIIDKTEYKTIEEAIRIKTELIKKFESDFGYHRNMNEFDRNYSYNYGILDKLNNHLNQTK